jgi:hypothetical protein
MRAAIASRRWPRLYELPAYTHELNPVEKVWPTMKRSMANHAVRTATALATAVKNRLQRMQYRHDLVDGYLTRQPDQWTQLVGNHEMQYLREPVFEWPERLHAHAIETMRRWWESGQLAVAAEVESADGDLLVTHAGVTGEFWESVLGAAPTAREAAATLNSLAAQGSGDVFRAGVMLHGSVDDGPVGPLWASAATELLPSWLHRELPFGQVHGHSSLFDWGRNRFRASRDIAAVTSVDALARHETSLLSGGRIIGVDPGHGRTPVAHWRSWPG